MQFPAPVLASLARLLFKLTVYLLVSLSLIHLYADHTCLSTSSYFKVTAALQDVVKIGALFTENERDGPTELAFKYAVYRINKDRALLPNATIVYDIQYIPKDDSFHAAKRACYQISSGVVAIIGPQDPLLGSHIQSLCDALDIPHIEFRVQHLAEASSASSPPQSPSSSSSSSSSSASASASSVSSTSLQGSAGPSSSAVSPYDPTGLGSSGLGSLGQSPSSPPASVSPASQSFSSYSGKEFSINLHPPTKSISDSLRELIIYLNWTEVAVIYEDDISLILLQELVKPPPLPKNVQFVFRKSNPESFRETLKDIKSRNIYSMIIDVKPESISAFVTAILQVQMNDYKYHYHMTTFDIEIFDLENIKYNFVNLTAFRLVDSSNSVVRHVLRDIERFSPKGKQILNKTNVIQAGPALMFDSVYALARGIHSLQKSLPRSILRSSNASCDTEVPWMDGSSLYNYINSVSFQGLTGRVQFAREGVRSYVKWDLLKLRNLKLDKVGEWTSTTGLNIMDPDAFHEFGTKNITLKVSTILVQPYIMLKKNFSGHNEHYITDLPDNFTGHISNDAYEGFCIDLLRAIADMLSFQYELYLVPDAKFGAEDADGNWNGLVRELMDKKADLAVAPMTINYARESVIDFTKPFMNLGIGILFKLPSTMPTRLFSFMSPLAVEIWFYVLAAYILVSSTMFIVARFSPYEWINPHPCRLDTDVVENQFSLANSFWFTIVTLMHQGCDLNPKAISTRIIGTIWWFFTLILISSYTANLAAFLTVERMITPIENVEDLAAQSKIQYGTLESGSTMTFFRDSRIETYQKMWKFMENRPSVFVKSYEEGVSRVLEGNYAFLMESTMIEYKVQRDCNLTQIGGLLDSKGYGIATPIGSPWRDQISLAILSLQDKGVIQMLYNKWWKHAGITCSRDEKNKEGKANALGVENIGGVFVVLLAGLTFAIGTAIFEFIWSSRKTAHSSRQSICSEMAEELRFAVKCRASRKRPALRRHCSKCGIISPLALNSTYVPTGVDIIPTTSNSIRCHGPGLHHHSGLTSLPPPPPPPMSPPPFASSTLESANSARHNLIHHRTTCSGHELLHSGHQLDHHSIACPPPPPDGGSKRSSPLLDTPCNECSIIQQQQQQQQQQAPLTPSAGQMRSNHLELHATSVNSGGQGNLMSGPPTTPVTSVSRNSPGHNLHSHHLLNSANNCSYGHTRMHS